MKLKYAIFISIVGLITLYIYQDDALRTRLMGKIHQVIPEINQSTLYQWQNSKGEWQVTDQPPKKGVVFTTITSQDQINVMPSPTRQKK